jgi:catechol 2,3-dioxygenase-like lactoylglutathione lyase family enzyme
VTTFNHVGHCVVDLERSRRFYEGLLGFQFWWKFDVPDDQAAGVLRLTPPLGMTAVYLIRDGLVLELLHYAAAGQTQPGRDRTMNEPGLTHISFSVEDLEATLARVEEFGGVILKDTNNAGVVVFIRDPDGQLLELSTMDWREHLPPAPAGAS